MDFAVFDPARDDYLKLLLSGRELTAKDFANPLAVIANYVFDSVEQDAFRVNNRELSETKFTIYRTERDYSLQDPVSIHNIRMEERYFAMELPYYDDPQLDSILEYYRNNLDQASIIFPIGWTTNYFQFDQIIQPGTYSFCSR